MDKFDIPAEFKDIIKACLDNGFFDLENLEAAVKSGKHIYMSAKQESIKDETAGITLYGPSMPGSKLGGQLPYLFDEVFKLGLGRTTEGVEYRYLQTRPDFQSDAKDRSGTLDAMEQPDLTHIINKVLNLT